MLHRQLSARYGPIIRECKIKGQTVMNGNYSVTSFICATLTTSKHKKTKLMVFAVGQKLVTVEAKIKAKKMQGKATLFAKKHERETYADKRMDFPPRDDETGRSEHAPCRLKCSVPTGRGKETSE